MLAQATLPSPTRLHYYALAKIHMNLVTISSILVSLLFVMLLIFVGCTN